MADKSTGPITRDELQALVALPFGKAGERIRQFDPQWGRAPGEKFAWKVTVERAGSDIGSGYVKAATQEEADKLADQLTDDEIDWDYSCGGLRVLSVEPDKPE